MYASPVMNTMSSSSQPREFPRGRWHRVAGQDFQPHAFFFSAVELFFDDGKLHENRRGIKRVLAARRKRPMERSAGANQGSQAKTTMTHLAQIDDAQIRYIGEKARICE